MGVKFQTMDVCNKYSRLAANCSAALILQEVLMILKKFETEWIKSTPEIMQHESEV